MKKDEEKSKRLTIRLPEDLHKKFKGYAALDGKSINEAAEGLIREFVQKAEKQLKK